jgi:hypothetical protein
MDAIRDWLKNPKMALILGLVAGLLVGLIFAWGIWPVKYVDAAPEHLQQDYARDYLQMAVENYSQTNDLPRAQLRWKGLGDIAPALLDELRKDPNLQPKVEAFAAAMQVPVAATTPGATLPAGTPQQPARNSTFLVIGIVLMCLITLGIGATIFYLVFLKGPRGASGGLTPKQQKLQAQPPMESATSDEPPIAQFMASYKLGDDLFDDSFSVDSPNGEFMGECGVGISETIGVGDPKKVTAFEVWLFDKNDIQTVTKVFMSRHAFEDEVTRQKLSAKGEPVLAEVGREVVLETQSLQLVARVIDMPYGEGALPQDSFFQRFELELAVWMK